MFFRQSDGKRQQEIPVTSIGSVTIDCFASRTKLLAWRPWPPSRGGAAGARRPLSCRSAYPPSRPGRGPPHSSLFALSLSMRLIWKILFICVYSRWCCCLQEISASIPRPSAFSRPKRCRTPGHLEGAHEPEIKAFDVLAMVCQNTLSDPTLN